MKINFERLLWILVITYIIEVILGGGGTITKYGSFSLRMLLLILNLIIVIFIALKKKVLKEKFLVVNLFFLVSIIFSTFVGIVNHADFQLVLLDIKKTLGFFVIIPIYYAVNSKKKIDIINNVIYKYTLILAFLFLVMLIGMKILNFALIYSLYSNLGDVEIIFRGDKGFLYKGFLYLNIGAIFYFIKNGMRNKIIGFLLLILLIFTYTRGFFVSLGLVLIFYVFFILKMREKMRVFFITLLLSPIIYKMIYKMVFLKEGVLESDSVRIVQIQQVFERINWGSFFIGHGYGIGVPLRMTGMEISFLEIFHKQGIIGLGFYGYLLLNICFSYKKLNDIESRRKYIPYVLSSIFIYLQSMTNPFITNPIGMTFVALSVVVGMELNRKEIEKKYGQTTNCTSDL